MDGMNRWMDATDSRDMGVTSSLDERNGNGGRRSRRACMDKIG